MGSLLKNENQIFDTIFVVAGFGEVSFGAKNGQRVAKSQLVKGVIFHAIAITSILQSISLFFTVFPVVTTVSSFSKEITDMITQNSKS